METQLRVLGLDAQRIEAVTPDDIAAELLDRHTSRRHLEHVKATELACSLSHLAAYRAFLASGEDFGLILEDDVVLGAAVTDILAAPLAGLDLIRLETYLAPQHHWPMPARRIGQFALHLVDSQCKGAAAYIISRKAAESLLAAPSALSRQFDLMLFDPFRQPGARFKTVQLIPALAIQDDRLDGVAYESDIQKKADPRPSKPAALVPLHGLLEFWLREIWMGLPKTFNHLSGRTRREIVPAAIDKLWN